LVGDDGEEESEVFVIIATTEGHVYGMRMREWGFWEVGLEV
jgi:hypothetical protein